MKSDRRLIIGHACLSVSFVLLFLALNLPTVIVISRLGSTVWYPAAGLVLALVLGVSPRYAFHAGFSSALAGMLLYQQPFTTFSETVGSAGVAGLYAAAAFLLRGPLKIDLSLHRRRDVVLYVSVTTCAALGSTGIGVACLAADHAIAWNEFWPSASRWFLGDEIGILGIAPFLLIHVCPWVRGRLSARPMDVQPKERKPRKKLWPLLEAIAQGATIVILLWLMFRPFQAFFLAFIPIIWIAMRQGVRRVATGLLLLNFGFVIRMHFAATTPNLLSRVGLLMFVLSATGLIVGSAVTERHRIAIELLNRTAQLTDANKQLLASTQKAEESSRIKSQFLANMSHEIRTPINGILGMAELVLDTHLSPDQRDYLAMLKSSGDSLLTVISDILDFSKMESGKVALDPIEFSLEETVGDTMRTLSPRVYKNGIELAYEIDPQIPELLVGDPGRLRQVLVNLVGNGIKFTAKGEVVVRVQIDSRTQNEISLHFSVSDTGIGIPAEKHSLIFDAFSQADGSTTRNYGGTGLGLAISSHLVGLMGGRIWLDSAVGEGSTFHFTIRLEVATRQLIPRVSSSQSKFQHLPILVVDDNPTSRSILLRLTQGWDMQSVAVESGVAALTAMQQAEIRGTRFRVAVIDSGMPDMTGFELAEQIKADRLLSEIKIIMLTSAGQAACCLRLGVAASLLKPIRKAELQSAILTALDERSPNNLPDAVLRFSPPEMSGGLRILVAEDNPVNQAVIVRMLQKLGHRPTIAHNGRQALSLLQGDTFDLVFMDVQMPEMDGLVATRTIRENEKRTGSHIPIVAMTAHAMKGYKESCLEAGMDDYLTKPLSSQSIDATLSRMFSATERKTPERAESCPSPSASPTWDRTKALERVEGDETLLRELVEIFLIEAPKQLENLAHAIVAADLDKIEKTAHSLKGELSYLGILDAAQKARDLERMGKEHSLAPAVALFPAFQTEMTALATEMRSMLDLC